jgi:transposase-like protein
MIDAARQFLQWLFALTERSAWEWRRCPHCGETETWKWGFYERRPWFFEGRQTVRVQRHRCRPCGRTYSEQSALLVRGGWYAREVRRCAIDHWQHGGLSVRRTAELLRSWLGRQERWRLWRPVDQGPERERSYLSATTVDRWLDGAGRTAQAQIAGQWAEVPSSGQLLTDGLWTRLRGGHKRVVLLLTDSVSGVIWPPVVATGEAAAEPWERLFTRAQQAGLALEELFGVASDGATGLASYLGRSVAWVNQQRCVFHLWRGLAGEFAAQAEAAAAGLTGAARRAARRAIRRELAALVRAVLDAADEDAAWVALVPLAEHPAGAGLARALTPHIEAALVHRRPDNQGLTRASPEWCWRDFRLRLSHGRNHGTAERLERAALVWAIYHNFTPAQDRRERRRTYRHSGRSPLAVAGASVEGLSYLDALAV